MIVRCEKCNREYDDGTHITFCPHDRFISDEAAQRKDLAYSIAEGPVCFAHQPNGPSHLIRSINYIGMITLDDMAGEFAPHLFVRSKDKT